MIKVLIADDQALIRGAFAALLSMESDLEVVASVGTAAEAVAAALHHAPDVALVDVQMPGRDGLDACAELSRRVPGCRTVILTTFGRPGYLSRALAAGAAGFLVKDAPPEQLVEAIRRVHSGLRFVDPSLAVESLSLGDSPLSDREREVLVAAAGGDPVATMARHLYLSGGTVRNYLSSIISKTGARGRGDAVRLATERGWL